MPHAKKTTVTLKILFYISTLLPCLTFAQTDKNNPIGTYSCSDGSFFYQLKINKDSTFSYEHSFKLGSTSSTGKWKLNKDTLYLFDYEKPWTIKQVEEKRIDSIEDNSVIEVIIADTDAIHTRGNSDIYIDGKPTKVKYDYKTNRHVVTDFELWTNDSCNKPQLTDKAGRTKFLKTIVFKITFDYDSYSVKDTKNNCFVLTLTNYPIFVSPPTLTWTKWLLTKNNLSPIDCNKRLDYITLKK